VSKFERRWGRFGIRADRGSIVVGGGFGRLSVASEPCRVQLRGGAFNQLLPSCENLAVPRAVVCHN
jgi:hypothetical protein